MRKGIYVTQVLCIKKYRRAAVRVPVLALVPKINSVSLHRLHDIASRFDEAAILASLPPSALAQLNLVPQSHALSRWWRGIASTRFRRPWSRDGNVSEVPLAMT